MRLHAACAVALVALAAAATALAAPKVTLSDIEDEVMCPTCGTALSLSESPLAARQRIFIQRLIDQGLSKDQIKARLVDEFGPRVLATPPRKGFSLAAYLVPLLGILLVLGSGAVALLRRRARGSRPEPEPPGESFAELVDADLADLPR